MNSRLLFACSLPCIILLSFGWSFNQESDDSKSKPAASSTSDRPQWLGPNRNGISAEIGLLKSWPATGPRILWRVPLGEGFSGVSISQGRVYTLFAQGNDEFVVCLDAASGKELWRARSGSTFKDMNGNGPRSTPTVHNEVVYALGAHGNLFALQSASGKKLWSHDLKKEFKTIEEIWESKVMLNIYTTSILQGDYLYGFDGGTLKCIEWNTGAEKWKQRGFGVGTLIYADGHLIVLGDKGKLALVEAAPTGYKEKAVAEILNGMCITVPALAADKLYVRNTKELVCLDMFGQYE